MSKQPTLTQLSEHNPDFQFFPGSLASADTEHSSGAVHGAYQAGLHYVAADLSELARFAPPNKSKAIMAIVRLVRAVADN
ncbi:MAG: hypothetical protein IPM60_05535 [Rhodospirillales bacterium]|nr:hypothetical protein [Rhodospirillales bacterium]